jgi:branched-chain amino acid transport system substrate-binding protein
MARRDVWRTRTRVLAATVGAVVLAGGVAACGSSSSNDKSGGTASGKGPILIGVSAAKTGALSPYDQQPTQAFELRVDEINKAGGVLGRKLAVKWIDTKSDKTLAASNATQLLNAGAVAILTTCDFDYGSPAAFAAAAKNVPGISLCASSPKNATPAIIGKYGFSMGTGSDTEGVAAAEWMRKEHPDWKRVYVLKDTSLEYSKATADYFAARFKQLGGTIAGRDTFVGGENTDISAQASRIKAKAGSLDAVYDGSWNPGGSTAVRQLRSAGVNLPIIGNQSTDGQLTQQVAGKVTGFYSTPLACIPSYCTGKGLDQDAVDKFASDFKAKYGKELANSYPINGYDLGTVLKQAIEKAGSAEPAKIATAMETMGQVKGINSTFQFSAKCHRPVGQSRIIMEYVKGQGQFISQVAAQDIPNIGDSNPCAGKQASIATGG